MFVVSAMLFGLGFGSAYPLFVAHLMHHVAEHRRGATFGALIGAFDTGIGTGSIAVGWISGRYGFGRAFGVRRRDCVAFDPVLPLHGEAPMDYVRLGTTGLKVSRLCLGTMTYGTPAWRPWVLDEATSRPFIKRAIEHGINFFDTADMYSRGVSEQVVGRALKEYAKRDEVVLATKVFYPVEDHANSRGLSRKHIMSAIDASLRRLGMDYVDLYQIHRFDEHTPIEETLEALHDVVKAGKALYIGASSMYAYQFAKMLCDAARNTAGRGSCRCRTTTTWSIGKKSGR